MEDPNEMKPKDTIDKLKQVYENAIEEEKKKGLTPEQQKQLDNLQKIYQEKMETKRFKENLKKREEQKKKEKNRKKEKVAKKQRKVNRKKKR